MHYIVVSGGVISGLGKGITASSIGLILKSYGYRVTAIKIDPYLNVDSGTMSPFEHGECFVLDDGGETDLDLGNYERFLDITLTQQHSLTSGKLYKAIIEKERRGDYLGKTVQMMPQVTDYIKTYLEEVSKKTNNKFLGNGSQTDEFLGNEICIIELGGTVGDYESNIYLEALSEFAKDHNVVHVHVSLLPVIKGDIKTKPVQQSVRILRSMGIDPQILVLRCNNNNNVSDEIMDKLSRMCKMDRDNIIINRDVPTIYHVPRLFMEQNIVAVLGKFLCDSNNRLNTIPKMIPRMESYNSLMEAIERKSRLPMIKVGIVGKYIGVQDTYLSLIRAIEHAGFAKNVNPQIVWINVDNNELENQLKKIDRVIIPGGFGNRGIEEMIWCARYCRENGVPIFGICLGMQIMCIELDRNVLGNPMATSEEFINDESKNEEFKNDKLKTVVLSDVMRSEKGGTMRLGSYKCKLKRESLLYKYYFNKSKNDESKNDELKNDESKNEGIIEERHRHRYEISQRFISELSNNTQYVISGKSVCGRYAEIIESKNEELKTNELKTNESKNDRFWLGCQFHPEYKSRHDSPSPLFLAFLS